MGAFGNTFAFMIETGGIGAMNESEEMRYGTFTVKQTKIITTSNLTAGEYD